MVNVYIPAAQAEASSPYAGGSGQQQPGQTSAQADAQNTIGRENRADKGLDGYGGRTSEQLNQINQQTEQERQQKSQQEQDRLNYEQRARVNAGNRPGYTDPSELGDTTTQNFLRMRRVLGAVGQPMPDEDVFLGGVLEGQRKIAVTTPGTRDDQFFTNELTKWNHNPIELSSAYHDVGMNAGAPIPANPFENRGDVALAFEKSGNQRDFTVDRYGFNPNVGNMINTLPNGQGLQETSWTVAKTGQPANVDFQPAIDYQVSQKGKYGPYGYLEGGVVDKVDVSVPLVKEPTGTAFNGLTVTGASVPGKGVGVLDKDWNPFVVSAAEPTGYISEGIQIPNTTPPQETNWLSGFEGFQKNISDKLYTAYGGTFGASGEQTKKYVENTAIIFETMANKNPILLPVAYGSGAVKETLDQPVKGAAILAVSYGSGMVFRGLTGVSSIAVEAAGPQFPKATKAFTVITKSAPYVLGGLYTTDVAIRSTEGGKNLGPGSIANKLGGISATEIAPMTIGFVGGYRSPEDASGVYRYTKTIPEKYANFRESIPTRDQLYYKYVELKTPSTAMSQPMASERFTVPRRPGSGPSSKFIESQRITDRGSGTRGFGERGTVSDRPTPRQESLRLNYNPTAPLTEIKSMEPKGFSSRGGIGGIRGTLRGKWDTATAATDEFASLPLKARWKAREGTLSSKGGFGSGGGKPTGNLQSGVGEGGTSVRSGGQYLDIKMPSSGIASQESSLAPQNLELVPSRRTAQRSRAYDLDFEYESRKLPEGMVRPGQNQDISTISLQTPTSESAVIPVLVSGSAIASSLKNSQNWIQDKFNKGLTATTPDQIPRQDERQKQSPVLIPMLGVTQIPTQIPRTDQIIIQRQDPTLITPPRIPVIQVPLKPPVDRPWTDITPPRPNVPDLPRIPPTEIGVPFIPILPGFGGGGGGTGSRRRGRKFTEYFPMGILAGVQAGYGLKTPKLARPKKGRVIPKSMLTPVKRKKK